MRIAAGVFCIIMLLFVAVQYNDPDAIIWIIIYGLAAFWCGVAALRPSLFSNPLWRRLLVATLVLSGVGVVWYWPHTEGFWHKDVWWITETAREGMGMWFHFAAMLVACLPLVLRRRHQV